MPECEHCEWEIGTEATLAQGRKDKGGADMLGFNANSTPEVVLLADGKPSSDWDSLNLQQLDYSSSISGFHCCSTDRSKTTARACDPLWNRTTTYTYGAGHNVKG